jgi:hypothetical protein
MSNEDFEVPEFEDDAPVAETIDWEAKYKEEQANTDWEAKYKALQASKETKEEPVTDGVQIHAYSTPGQLDVEGGDPTKRRRWVRKYDAKLKMPNASAVNARKVQGYEVCQDPNIVAASMGNGDIKETHDLVLMEISEEGAKKIEEQKKARANAAVTAVTESNLNSGLEEMS